MARHLPFRAIIPLVVAALFSATVFGQEKPKRDPQEGLKQDPNAMVTIVTKGDISVTDGIEGKTTVVVNFAPNNKNSKERRVVFKGVYSLDVNGGVKEVIKPDGIELTVLSYEDFRATVPAVQEWEKANSFDTSRCHNIEHTHSCGNPICDQATYPGFTCRYNSGGGGCACTKAGVAVACSELLQPSPQASLFSK
jgi:hypothetical protein